MYRRVHINTAVRSRYEAISFCRADGLREVEKIYTVATPGQSSTATLLFFTQPGGDRLSRGYPCNAAALTSARNRNCVALSSHLKTKGLFASSWAEYKEKVTEQEQSSTRRRGPLRRQSCPKLGRRFWDAVLFYTAATYRGALCGGEEERVLLRDFFCGGRERGGGSCWVEFCLVIAVSVTRSQTTIGRTRERERERSEAWTPFAQTISLCSREGDCRSLDLLSSFGAPKLLSGWMRATLPRAL